MPFNQFTIETTDCDFKEQLEIKKPKSWLKSVSAFANGIGGSLIFGVDDQRNVVGLDEPQTVAENISRLIKERISPIPEIVLTSVVEQNKILLFLKFVPEEIHLISIMPTVLCKPLYALATKVFLPPIIS